MTVQCVLVYQGHQTNVVEFLFCSCHFLNNILQQPWSSPRSGDPEKV